MIQLKRHDLLEIKEIESGKIYLSILAKVDKDGPFLYTTFDWFGFNEDLGDKYHKREIVVAWRYDGKTGNFLKIYDASESREDDEPAIIEYEKYLQLQHENEELRDIIVELNRKIHDLENW